MRLLLLHPTFTPAACYAPHLCPTLVKKKSLNSVAHMYHFTFQFGSFASFARLLPLDARPAHYAVYICSPSVVGGAVTVVTQFTLAALTYRIAALVSFTLGWFDTVV